MTERDPAADIVEPAVISSRGGGVSLIWLVPVFALLLGAGLAWQYYANLGPVISITFESAEGVAAGATRVRYKQVDIGDVIAVGLDPDTDKVIIKARIDKNAQHLLGSATRFWIVKPRATIGGISGIGTILGGAYIDTDPGGAPGATAFAGLEEPPLTPFSTPGLRIILKSTEGRSVRVGTPVYYRRIKVGQVDGRRFTDNFNAVELDVFIQKTYAGLISTNSRFWDASGLDVSITAQGADIRTPSLESLLEGGISFDTPPNTGAGERVENGAQYLLYADQTGAFAGGLSDNVRYLLYFDGSVRGLNSGAPVEFRGIPVGAVVGVKLSYNTRTNEVSIPVLIEIDPLRLFAERLDATEVHFRISQLVRQGLKAQLKSGNLVTGQLLVELAMYPTRQVFEVAREGDLRVLPTVPNTITQISQRLEGLLTKFTELEIEPVLAETQALIAELRGFAAAPTFKALPGRIDAAASAVETLVEGKATGVAGTLTPGGELHDELVDALKDLRKMADSLRALSDTLEEKPNALLFGKGRKPRPRPAPKSSHDRQ